jgi:hypothetical protein
MKSRVFIACLCALLPSMLSAEGLQKYRDEVEPVLSELCFDCHGDGAKKGDVILDTLESDAAMLSNRDLWWKVLKMVRAELMPPNDKPQPTTEQRKLLEGWIKTAVFEVDPQNPDPGQVTLRRLNRIEYRNTVKDLMGVDFN